MFFSCTQVKNKVDIKVDKEEAVYKPNWESLKKKNITPDWFLDAKFGIYTHWGPNSGNFKKCEEGEFYDGWHGMFMYGKNGRVDWKTGKVSDATPTTNYQLHLKTYGDPAEFNNEFIIKQFETTGFNAKEWAELFAKSGAKFAGNVAIHHDNFAMWDSKATRWNSMNYGGVDVSKKLKTEVETQGMKYLASFHHAFTWLYYAPAHEYGGVIDPNDYDLYTDPHTIKDTEPTDRFYDEWWAKLKEFIDVYQPDIIWFDWWLENMTEESRQKFLAYYYNKGIEWNKEVAVTFKESTFPEGTAIRDYERGRPNQPKSAAWITDTSPGAWFYRSNAKFVKANDLIDILTDIVAKNGCMLLNVPPNPDGTIPQEMKDLLLEIGSWLKVNGEAIYGTRTWNIFGEGPTRLEEGGHKVEEKGKIQYTNKDIRFTKKSETEFYAIILDTPDENIQINSLSTLLGVLNGTIKEVTLIGSNEKIIWERNEKGLLIQSPENYPTAHAHAFKIELEAYVEKDI